jgi:hypothetical protein
MIEFKIIKAMKKKELDRLEKNGMVDFLENDSNDEQEEKTGN